MNRPEEEHTPPHDKPAQGRGSSLLHLFVPGARSADDHASLFNMLTRYTRFVLLSKWFLGVFAVVLLVMLIAWPLASKQDGSRISFSGQTAGEAGSASYPTMYNPRFQGVDGEMRQYTVTADKAIQQTKELAQLENVKAELFFADQSWLTITANAGTFSEKEQKLDLSGNVTLTHAAGYVVVTDQAHMLVKQNYAWGDGPVQGVGPTGKLLATGFEIRDNGSRMIFGKQGRVNVAISRNSP